MLAERYLALCRTANTKRLYGHALKLFARSIYGEAATLESLDGYVGEVRAGRDAQLDVERFFVGMRGFAPKTIEMCMVPIKTFLEDNDIEFKRRLWRRLRASNRGGVMSIDQPPTPGELKEMVGFMPINGRALVLMLASGGFRIGELMGLAAADIDLEAVPARVRVKAATTKTGRPRVAFISSEAAEAVRAWLKVRPAYLRTADGRSWKYRRGEGVLPMLFPFCDSVIRHSYANALRKAKLDQRDAATGRYLRHIHTLRKFFKTEFTKAVKNPEIAEALMGHDAGVRTVYSKYTLEDIAKVYLEGEGALTLFSNRAEVLKLKGEIEQKDRFTAEVVGGQQGRIEKLERDVAVLTDVLKKQGTIKVQ